MTDNNKFLQRLEEKQAKLKEQIKQAKGQQKKKQAATFDIRARIIGAAVIAEMKENETFSKSIDQITQARITSPKERKILDLKPLAKKEEKKIPANAG